LVAEPLKKTGVIPSIEPEFAAGKSLENCGFVREWSKPLATSRAAARGKLDSGKDYRRT
tara:strand:- start:176250 stop:176426 length:177 start_codon:yes stop_codon:yes gene_type:complete